MRTIEAAMIRPGDVVSYNGRRARANAISARGIAAPHFTLSYLDGAGGGEAWTSHALVSLVPAVVQS